MIQKKQKGFTLIELLVVIAIIGLLASIVLLALNSARAKSRDAKRIADVREMMTGLELYYNNFGGYPLTVAALVPNYIGSTPQSPTPADGPCPASTSANGYVYASSGTSFTGSDGSTVVPSYSVTFCLGGSTGGYASGTHTASPTGLN
jgi:prepilin-type N-terminal cleavage/methylation domain-containing protein